jgi:hypothetical protein
MMKRCKASPIGAKCIPSVHSPTCVWCGEDTMYASAPAPGCGCQAIGWSTPAGVASLCTLVCGACGRRWIWDTMDRRWHSDWGETS